MAFWQRKEGRRVFVYFWCGETGKQKVVSRALTSHLDGATDQTIDQWVRTWQLSQDSLLKKTLNPIADPHLVSLVNQFCKHQIEDFKRHPYTVQAHSRNLIHFALPYFFGELHLSNLSEIQTYSVKMNYFLRDELKLRTTKIRSVQMSLRMFWRWLEEERHVEGKLLLRRTATPPSDTPLIQTPTPVDILSWSTPHEDLELLILIGYFFSLRPQETLALRAIDFIAGQLAFEQEACKVMHQADLFARLALRVSLQRSRRIGLTAPKAGSRGFVACFHEEAAQRIVRILRKRSPNDFLFPFGNDWYFKRWRRDGYARLTLKDCRRASLYWLGHYSKLDLVALRNHARHADIKTTSLYTRRPLYEDLPGGGDLELY